MEAVLERLDRLTREEAQTTATQTLELVYGLVKNIRVVMDGAHDLLASSPCCINRRIPSRERRINGWCPSNSRYVLLIRCPVTINSSASGHPPGSGRHEQIETCVQMLRP